MAAAERILFQATARLYYIRPISADKSPSLTVFLKLHLRFFRILRMVILVHEYYAFPLRRYNQVRPYSFELSSLYNRLFRDPAIRVACGAWAFVGIIAQGIALCYILLCLLFLRGLLFELNDPQNGTLFNERKRNIHFECSPEKSP